MAVGEKPGMNKITVVSGACFLLLIAQAGTADTLKLSHGGKLKGTLRELTFDSDGKDTTYVREVISSVQLGPDERTPDQIVLKDGKKLKGQLVRVDFKTIAGVLSFTKNKIASIQLGESGRPEKVAGGPAKPASKPDTRYEDQVTLEMGGELKAAVVAANVGISGKTVTLARQRMSAIQLSEDADDTIVLADGRKLRCRLESLMLKSGSMTGTFVRDEIRRIELKVPGVGKASATSAPSRGGLDAKQKGMLEMSTRLSGTYMKRIADEKTKRLQEIEAAIPNKALDQATTALRSAQKDASRLKQWWEKNKGLLFTAHLGQPGRETKADLNGLKRILATCPPGLLGGKTGTALWNDVVRGSGRVVVINYQPIKFVVLNAPSWLKRAKAAKDALSNQKRGEMASAHKWVQIRNAEIRNVLAKHTIIVRLGGALTEAQMAASYQAAFEKSKSATRKPVRPVVDLSEIGLVPSTQKPTSGKPRK